MLPRLSLRARPVLSLHRRLLASTTSAPDDEAEPAKKKRAPRKKAVEPSSSSPYMPTAEAEALVHAALAAADAQLSGPLSAWVSGAVRLAVPPPGAVYLRWLLWPISPQPRAAMTSPLTSSLNGQITTQNPQGGEGVVRDENGELTLTGAPVLPLAPADAARVAADVAAYRADLNSHARHAAHRAPESASSHTREQDAAFDALSAADRSTIAEMRAAGASQRAVARDYGIHPLHVARVAAAALDAPGPPTKARRRRTFATEHIKGPLAPGAAVQAE